MILVTFCTKLYLRSCHRTTKYLPTYVNSSMDLDKVSFVDVRTYVRLYICASFEFFEIFNFFLFFLNRQYCSIDLSSIHTFLLSER